MLFQSLVHLYVFAVLYIILGADYADGDSAEGKTSKEKGTRGQRRIMLYQSLVCIYCTAHYSRY